MIRALMWKEYREHRPFWLTLALGGGAGLYGLSQLLGPVWGMNYQIVHESLQAVAVLLAWAYGLICGAMLLANEREAGTMTFLDMLPLRRLELWLVKCLFGLLLLLAQMAVLLGFVLGLGITETSGQLLATLLAMLVFGLFAMSWSLLFSAQGENVLNVIGLSFVSQIAAVLATSLLLMALAIVLAVLGHAEGEPTKFGLACLSVLGLTLAPIAGSARLFTRLDRQRNRFGTVNPRRLEKMSVWAGWGRLLWLSYVQMRRLVVGLLSFALLLGLLMLVAGPVAWPILTLFIGVLCGVTVWSDEQLSASFRFLGDQRFPLGRVWIVKISMHFTLAVLAAFVLLLPSLILAGIHRLEARVPGEHMLFFADVLHSSLIGGIVPVGLHLSLWLLYGFTVGQLCGMLFRKSLVAGVVGLGTAGLLVSLWVPSLVGIGLQFWQTAGVPLFLLLTSWLLLPAWVADRLLTSNSFVRLGLALLAAGVWTTGGLWYRVAEIPETSEPFDVAAFEAGIPPMDPDKNPAGMAIRGAWSQLDHLDQELMRKRGGRPLFPDVPAANNQDRSFLLEIDAALRRGWPDRPSELGDWLDRKFQEDWYGHLAETPRLPLGTVENLKQMTVGDALHKWWNARFLNEVLAVRGLQQQTQGDPRAFVDNLDISLAVSRNLEYKAPMIVVRAGREAELIGVAALDRWLEQLPPGHPELLERVRDILLRHEAQLPDEAEAVKAAYLIARNSLASVPEKLIERQTASTARQDDPRLRKLRQSEIEAAALLWRISWEQERHERIVRLGFQDLRQPGRQAPPQMRQAEKWEAATLIALVPPPLKPRSKRNIALLHAAQLKVAVRLYQDRNQGRPPTAANELVPRYLPALPIDPFDGQPLRYRISKGEKLGWFKEAPAAGPPVPPGMGQPGQMAEIPPAPPTKQVKADRVILWSVGEDGQDDGGRQQGIHILTTSAGEDLIYLVPPPP